ncbi:MAG: hypothetical protein M1835_003600 [Candelina submexicana]|nr:MAG: hypothetical protein M1835_003600 [Candelina submexicana]
MSLEAFPHAEYAEDQRSERYILTIHVFHRAFTTGAIVGTFGYLGAAVLLRRRYPNRFPLNLLQISRAAATGSVVGPAFAGAGLVLRMYGREKIEWQDRSWRLLANEGQNRVDRWSLAGILLGSGTMLALSRRRGWQSIAAKDGLTNINSIAMIRGWRVPVGGAALGSMGGVVGYLVDANSRGKPASVGDAAGLPKDISLEPTTRT